MTSCSPARIHAPGLAFDGIAEQYDDLFTRSLIGRAQRDTVWDVLRQEFRAGHRVLELNCGTGEDALFLSRLGASVYACDASERMIAVAASRMARESRGAEVRLEVRSTEQIGGLRSAGLFDGVLSNFSGLNCVADIEDVAQQLATLVKPHGRLVLCLSTRVCLWETLWYLGQGEPYRAVRRWRGSAMASLGNVTLQVRYPTLRDMRRVFAPGFALRSIRGVGVTVPPSYVEHLARRYPRVLRAFQDIDRVIADWPVCRVIGDHLLLVLERTSQ
jgi:SAM-dependent methyltransferase